MGFVCSSGDPREGGHLEGLPRLNNSAHKQRPSSSSDAHRFFVRRFFVFREEVTLSTRAAPASLRLQRQAIKRERSCLRRPALSLARGSLVRAARSLPGSTPALLPQGHAPQADRPGRAVRVGARRRAAALRSCQGRGLPDRVAMPACIQIEGARSTHAAVVPGTGLGRATAHHTALASPRSACSGYALGEGSTSRAASCFSLCYSSIGSPGYASPPEGGLECTRTWSQVSPWWQGVGYAGGTGRRSALVDLFFKGALEWYINEDSFNGLNPRGSVTATIDGATYYLSTNTTTGTGGANACESGHTGSWTQMISTRKTARQCGTVTVSDHFAAWAQQGWSLGTLSSVHINVEVGGGTGSVEFPVANVTTTSK